MLGRPFVLREHFCFNVSAATISGVQCFIGLKDVVGNNQLSSHRWIHDNSVLAYHNFHGGEPSNPEEICITILVSGGNWNDVPCDYSAQAVCEADPVRKSFYSFDKIYFSKREREQIYFSQPTYHKISSHKQHWKRNRLRRHNNKRYFNLKKKLFISYRYIGNV